MPFHHKYTEQGQKQVENTGGKMLTGRKAKIMMALEKDMDPDDAKMMMSRQSTSKPTEGLKVKRVQRPKRIMLLGLRGFI